MKYSTWNEPVGLTWEQALWYGTASSSVAAATRPSDQRLVDRLWQATDMTETTAQVSDVHLELWTLVHHILLRRAWIMWVPRALDWNRAVSYAQRVWHVVSTHTADTKRPLP